MKTTNKISAGLLALTLTAGTLIAPVTANASEEGKRNTAIGVGALALGLLLTQKNKLPGIVAAGGAAYAYSQYDASIRARHRRENDGYYYRNDNYGYGSQDGYRYGENGGSYDSRAAHRQAKRR